MPGGKLVEADVKRIITSVGVMIRESKHTPELGLFEEMQYLRRLREHIDRELRDCELVAENPKEYSR